MPLVEKKIEILSVQKWKNKLEKFNSSRINYQCFSESGNKPL